MSFSTVERDIEQRLLDNWVATEVDINPNVDFETPAPGTDWIKLEILHDGAQRAGPGQPAVIRHRGRIRVDIFTSLDTGTAGSNVYLNILFSLFEEAQFGGVICETAITNGGGQHRGWWRERVEFPFWWDGRYNT